MELHEQVADRGRFGRSGNDRTLQRIRRQLIQEDIPRSATNDHQFIDA